jgi:glutaminyl-peptide cyclotransferase
MKLRVFAAALFFTCSGFCERSVAGTANTPAPIYTYQIVHTYPHDRSAFTEGLLFKDGFIYESTGLNGRSFIRKERLDTGEVLQQHNLPDTIFGEGITDWGDELISVTWRSEVGFVWDLKNFDYKKSFRYSGEGWGMTHSSTQLLLSDGTSRIRLLNPQTLQEAGSINVTDNGAPVTQLNELEWVKGQIYANVWQTDRIARIDPKTGRVASWLDLSGLLSQSNVNADGADVLNGIAYDAAHDRLFITGKLWPLIFEIKVVEPAAKK